MKKIIAIGSFLILLVTQSWGQLSRKTENKAVNQAILEIKKYNILEDQLIGIHNDTSNQYKRFLVLQNKYTSDELLNVLKNESNKVLKLYSFVALNNKKVPIDGEIMKNLSGDISIITYQSGCNVRNMTVSTFVKQYNILGKKLLH